MSDAPSLKATYCSSANVPAPFLVSEWDPLMAAAQNVNYNGASAFSNFNVSMLGSQGIHCSKLSLAEQVARFPCFISDSLPVANPSLPLSENTHNIPPENNEGIGKDSNWKKRENGPDCSAFDSDLSLNRTEDAEFEHLKNVLPETGKGSEEGDEKRQKSEQNSGGNTRKSTPKQAKELPQNGDAPKEDYIHVRAKRGQATNSHSLAERVRREKISERMRFLQNLVPGCNKITGKAVMLDEIINYVQSLQRQVEFLSMKLASVNPELDFDIDQILSKDILQLRPGAPYGFDPGMSYSHPHSGGPIQPAVMQPEMIIHNIPVSEGMLKSTLSNIPTMPQASRMWDDELQNVFQMGFIHNVPVSSSNREVPGSIKLK